MNFAQTTTILPRYNGRAIICANVRGLSHVWLSGILLFNELRKVLYQLEKEIEDDLPQFQELLLNLRFALFPGGF